MTAQLICSYCGGTNFIACKQPHGYAGLVLADKKLTFNGQTLYHDVCKACGTIVRSYIEQPQRL
ncbi:hypothetical protein [Streptococcus merionis]|uniref:hypothetical protein n=1 Tax=Streptococcus merionis TaxID=400065 RepID=UPI0026ED348A|nr:hypothetical protein [Streptococcus merionis]